MIMAEFLMVQRPVCFPPSSIEKAPWASDNASSTWQAPLPLSSPSSHFVHIKTHDAQNLINGTPNPAVQYHLGDNPHRCGLVHVEELCQGRNRDAGVQLGAP